LLLRAAALPRRSTAAARERYALRAHRVVARRENQQRTSSSMTIKFIQGDCREVLRNLPPESVHMVVTSPPYWGLRDYKIPPSIWGGDLACDHEWDQEIRTIDNHNGSSGNTWEGGSILANKGSRYSQIQTEFCLLCGALRGALGLEPSIHLYVEHIVEVFREVHRVLRPDGTLWLNLGDSYATGTSVNRPPSRMAEHGHWSTPEIALRINGAKDGLKPKDLCGIPWRVALALQEDGWWLRQDIIWAKINPMPESVTDRCTKSHEYVFLLSKSEKYYYDHMAIAEPLDRPDEAQRKTPGKFGGANKHIKASKQSRLHSGNEYTGTATGTRNKRSVWTIASKPFKGSHFAVFPPKLVEPCIKAGTSERGCCSRCGAPQERIIEKASQGSPNNASIRGHSPSSCASGSPQRANMFTETATIDWQPSCTCNADVIPCTVLDPFGGAGTTGLVADRLHRDAVLIELNPEYIDMAQCRIRDESPLFSEII
jgi:DNA modification methylase